MADEEGAGGLSLQEAAAALNCSHKTVRAMVKRGDLDVQREKWQGLQRRIWVTAASVAALIERRKQNG